MTDIVAGRNSEQLFRPISYLGSKFLHLHSIHSIAVEESRGRRLFLDLFSGSGVVAGHAARGGFAVVASDVQEYSRVLASAFLSPRRLRLSSAAEVIAHAQSERQIQSAPLRELFELEESARDAWRLRRDPMPLCRLLDRGAFVSIDDEGDARASLFDRSANCALPNDAAILKHYGGLYFSCRQAFDLDCLIHALRWVDVGDDMVALRAGLLTTASTIVTSVGNQFAQPLRPTHPDGAPKPGAAQRISTQWSRDVLTEFARASEMWSRLAPVRATRAHEAICADYRLALDEHLSSAAIVYADPPYTRDHYSRFYHVLETIARGDSPWALKHGPAPRAVYRTDRHQSPFCVRSQAVDAFAALFERVARAEALLLLSYSGSDSARNSHPRTMALNDVCELAARFFPRVTLRHLSAELHSRLNKSSLVKTSSRNNAEVLLVCQA